MTNERAAAVAAFADMVLVSSVATRPRCVSHEAMTFSPSDVFMMLMHHKMKNKDCSRIPNPKSRFSSPSRVSSLLGESQATEGAT